MASTRPYLIRAIFEWACDNGHTPHLLVNAEYPDVEVPADFVNDGQIVLNINPTAVRDLELGDDWILFNARFSGQPQIVQIPVAAVQAIYARENGQGIFFPPEDELPGPDDGEDGPGGDGPPRPVLKVVK
jgi:stringent starvation protein B